MQRQAEGQFMVRPDAPYGTVRGGTGAGAGIGAAVGALAGAEIDAWVLLAVCPPVSALALLVEPAAASDGISQATRKPMR
jgi:hypothetical protein